MSDIPLTPEDEALTNLMSGQGMGGIDPAVAAMMLQFYLQGANPNDMSLSDPNMQTTWGTLPEGSDYGDASAAMRFLSDPALARLTGAGGYAPGTFDDTVSYEPVERPGYNELQLLARSPDTAMGFIAQHILGGGSAEEAVALLQARVEAALGQEGVNGDITLLDDVTRNLIRTLPVPGPGEVDPVAPLEGMAQWDWDALRMEGRDLSMRVASDPQPGGGGAIFDASGAQVSEGTNFVLGKDAQGNEILLEVTTTPSEAAKDFTDRGLPLPTDEYTPEMLLGEDWQAAVQRAMMSEAELGQARESRNTARSLEEQWADREREYLTGAASPQVEPIEDSVAAAQRVAASGEEPAPLPVRNYPVEAIDVTGEVPSALENAIRNGSDQQWMTANWDSISDADRAAAREVLASYGLSAALYGFEVPLSEEHPGAAEDIGTLIQGDTRDLPRSDAGFLAGEAAQALEGLIGDQQATTAWLQGNYQHLNPEEERQVRQTLANYGLTVEDYIPAGGGGGIPNPAGRMPALQPLMQRRMAEMVSQGDQPEPGGGEQFPWEGLYGSQNEQPEPRDVQRDAAVSEGKLLPPSWIIDADGNINPMYLEYLDQLRNVQVGGLNEGDIANIFPGGTGAITPDNYGGGPTPGFRIPATPQGKTYRAPWTPNPSEAAEQLSPPLHIPSQSEEQQEQMRNRRNPTRSYSVQENQNYIDAVRSNAAAFQEAYGYNTGQALAQSQRLREQGRRPLTDALLRQRMTAMALFGTGSAPTGYLPGVGG